MPIYILNEVQETFIDKKIISLDAQAGETSTFTIDARDAGDAEPTVELKPAGESFRAPCRAPEITDNKVFIFFTFYIYITSLCIEVLPEFDMFTNF